MKVAVLTSGGKDSIYAAYLASKTHELSCLVSMKSENPESYMFHVPNIHLVELQAKAMNLPLIFESTKGEKEKELEDLKRAISRAKEEYGVKGIVSGALASVYQKKRIENICKKLDLASITPLWGIDPEEYVLTDLTNREQQILLSLVPNALICLKEWLEENNINC